MAKTWISTTSSTWGTAGNWSPSGIPTATDDVIFNSTYGGSCSVSSTSTCKSIVMTGYSGVFSGSGNLSITGSDNGLLNGSGNTIVLSAVGNTSNFTYTGIITITAVNGTGKIYCNGKSFNAQITFNSGAGIWSCMDIFKSTGLLLLSSGSVVFSSDAYIGTINTSGSVARTFSVNGSLYLTGSSNLISATTTTNLIWTSSSIYVWGTQSSARTLTFNTVVYTKYCELAGNGSGQITLAAGSTGVPRVGVTNTGGAIVNFTSSTLSELIFSGGTNVVWSNAASQTLTISGDLKLVSTMVTPTLTPAIIFRGDGNGLVYDSRITLAGKSLVTGSITLNDTTSPRGAGSGTFTFVDAFSSNSSVTITSAGVVNINANFSITTSSTFTLTTGTLNVNNGANITTGLFASTNSTPRVLNMGSGNWTITGTGTVWNITTSTNMTLNCETSRIVITDTSATVNTFASGGSFTYYTIEYARGGGGSRLNLDSLGSGNTTTIANFIDNTSTVAHSLNFGAGTYNFYKFNVRGTAGALVTISRSGAISPVLNKVGQGIVSYCDYLNISTASHTATPANTWYAGSNSTGSGWVMTAAPTSRSTLGVGGVG
jgi:hypothetical protein